MGPNRRAQEGEPAAAEATPKAKCVEVERKVIAEAERIFPIWNARQGGGRALWFYPTIGATIAAGLPWLSFSCSACRQLGSVDLRTLDRHRGARYTSLSRKARRTPQGRHPAGVSATGEAGDLASRPGGFPGFPSGPSLPDNTAALIAAEMRRRQQAAVVSTAGEQGLPLPPIAGTAPTAPPPVQVTGAAVAPLSTNANVAAAISGGSEVRVDAQVI